jgi:hypothetical protein
MFSQSLLIEGHPYTAILVYFMIAVVLGIVVYKIFCHVLSSLVRLNSALGHSLDNLFSQMPVLSSQNAFYPR